MTQTGTPTGWQDYTELEKLTHALADKVRLNIVRILANSQEVNVTDLTRQLLISQPLVSWHLAILRRNGLVRTRRQGRQVYCSLDAARCQQSLRQLGDVINGAPASATTAPAMCRLARQAIPRCVHQTHRANPRVSQQASQMAPVLPGNSKP